MFCCVRPQPNQPNMSARSLCVFMWSSRVCAFVADRQFLAVRLFLLFFYLRSLLPPQICFAMYLRVQHEWQKWMCWIAYARVRSVDHVYIDCGALAKTNATHCITQAHNFRFDPLRVIRALGCFCCHHLHVRRSYVVAYISCRLTDPVRNDEFICVDIEIMLFTVCFFPKYSNKRNTKNRTKWYFWFFFCVFFVVECHSVAKRRTPSYLPHRMGINCFNCTSWMAHQQQQQEQQQRSLWLPCLNSSKRNSSVMSV